MADPTTNEGGLWRRHFHWSVLLKWEVLGWIIAALPTVAGILLVFDQYVGANICFMVTAAFLFAKIVHVAAIASDPAWHRIVFVFVLSGIVGVAIVETVRGVNRWALKHKVETATTEQPPKRPQQSGSIEPAKPSPEAALLAPAGFITFIGQIIDGYAPMMQENQTENPLDDVHLSIFSAVPKSRAPKTDDEWGSGTVVWEKEIEIGTCRARLTTGLQERFPIAGQKHLFCHILMLTRLQTYRETIKLTKISDKEYSAQLDFYGGGANPLYTRHMKLGIMNTQDRHIAVHSPMAAHVANELEKLDATEGAKLQFTFWPVDPNEEKLYDETSLPVVDNVVTVAFTAKNVGSAQADNGQVWIQICDGCKFAEEPPGTTIESPIVRRKRFDALYMGSYFEGTTLKVIPPAGATYFTVVLKYACEKCPSIDNKHPQKLRINLTRPS
jgi:hypothetical protein